MSLVAVDEDNIYCWEYLCDARGSIRNDDIYTVTVTESVIHRTGLISLLRPWHQIAPRAKSQESFRIVMLRTHHKRYANVVLKQSTLCVRYWKRLRIMFERSLTNCSHSRETSQTDRQTDRQRSMFSSESTSLHRPIVARLQSDRINHGTTDAYIYTTGPSIPRVSRKPF